MKQLNKIKELKEKDNPESLHALREDSLVGMQILYRFDYGKYLSK